MTPLALFLIRHGESTWNAARRWQGQGDPPLSMRGRDQARGLARTLAERDVESIVTSDLRRARQTAAILGAELGVEPTLEPRLRERDLGVWAGRSGEEIGARWPDELARLRAGDPTLRPGGGETLAELRERVTKALEDLAATARAQRVAVVTHLGVIRLLAPGHELHNAELVGTTLGAARRALRSGTGLDGAPAGRGR